VGPRAGVDTVARSKNVTLFWETNPQIYLTLLYDLSPPGALQHYEEECSKWPKALNRTAYGESL